MINSMKKCLVLFCCVIGMSSMSAQVGYGLTFSNDIYNRYANPSDGIASNANGSFLLNLALGPKIWFGGEKMSFSVETQANIGLLGLSLGDYKGLGSFSVPLIGKLNFAGLSGLNKEGGFGFSVGGGMQWNKTEIYKLKDSFKEQGVKREYYKTYVIQAGYGFGVSGFAVYGFARYGFNPDLTGANNVHVGLQFDFNIPYLKRIDDPASAL